MRLAISSCSSINIPNQIHNLCNRYGCYFNFVSTALLIDGNDIFTLFVNLDSLVKIHHFLDNISSNGLLSFVVILSFAIWPPPYCCSSSADALTSCNTDFNSASLFLLVSCVAYGRYQNLKRKKRNIGNGNVTRKRAS